MSRMFPHKKSAADAHQHFTDALYEEDKGKMALRQAHAKNRPALFTSLFSRGKIQIRPLGKAGETCKERKQWKKEKDSDPISDS